MENFEGSRRTLRTTPWHGATLFAILLGGTACGDLGDPVLLSVDVTDGGTVVQSLEIDINGSNFFPNDVSPTSAFVMTYDEPVNLESVKAHVLIQDAADVTVPTTITQRLVDIIVTPNAAMGSGQNHTLAIANGIDDESANTTDYYVNVTFYVN